MAVGRTLPSLPQTRFTVQQGPLRARLTSFGLPSMYMLWSLNIIPFSYNSLSLAQESLGLLLVHLNEFASQIS